ncbi:Segregation and condensation protein B [hydrothermal vent metagenome]|uniref:Segregation and condensation protein B n=1 Tax=hydrothermal vent metagenome TaxID=652676 RepID=A0A3B1B1Q7_9ZZZZ
MSSEQKLKMIIEAALLAAGKPQSLDDLLALFDVTYLPERTAVRQAIADLAEDYAGRGIEVREVGSGFRIQVRAEFSPWISRLWAERPPRYSRALMETLALIAYRQPVTRGEIEEVRGVSVSTNIIRTLLEREWVRVVGQRDVPGKPSLYATTKEFLDYFSLKSLAELPSLAEIRDLDSINRELELEIPGISSSGDAEVVDQDEPAEEESQTGITDQSPPDEIPRV